MILGLLFFIVALVAVVLLTINLWLPSVIKMFVEKKSNFPTNIQKSNISLKNGVVDFDGINLKNPKGKYERENFITLKKLTAGVEYNTLTSKQIVIPEITIDIDDLTLEQNKDGKINAMELVNAFTGEESEEEKKKEEEEEKKHEQQKKEEEKKEESKSFIIRKLNIRLGTIELYGFSEENAQHVFDLNKSFNFENVSLENKKEIIAQILNDPDIQNCGASVAMEAALGVGKKYVSDAVKKYSEQGKKYVNDAADKLKEYIPEETVNSIKESLPDDIKKVIPDNLDDAANKIKQAIPDDVKKRIPSSFKNLFG